MKPPAVVANLWPGQSRILEAFLELYGPTTIVSPTRFVTDEVRGIVAAHECEVIKLNSLLPRGYVGAKEAAGALTGLKSYLAGRTAFADELGGPGNEVMRPIIEDSLVRELPAAVQMLDALEAARTQYNVVLFVTTEDATQLARPATAWAVAHGIPSLHISHSIALGDPVTVHAHLVADRLAVYGQRGAEGYLDLGIAPKRIAITGNPAWDVYAGLAEKRSAIRADLDAKYGFDPDLPLVVFGTTWAGHLSALEPPGDVNLTSLQAFVDACEELAVQGFRFNAVVKDRPANTRGGDAVLEDAVADRGALRQQILRTSEDTREFAVAADVLIAVDSNYLVEAMLVGTPAINLVSDRLALYGPTFDEESGIVESEPDQLADRIRMLIDDAGFRAARLAQSASHRGYYNFAGTDGRSAARVGAVMKSMALSPKRWLMKLEDAGDQVSAFGEDTWDRVRTFAVRVRRRLRRAWGAGRGA